MEIKLTQDGKKRFINIKAEIAENPQPSSSGKSLSLASTNGNKTLEDIKVDGQPVVVGLNVYIKNKDFKPGA